MYVWGVKGDIFYWLDVVRDLRVANTAQCRFVNL